MECVFQHSSECTESSLLSLSLTYLPSQTDNHFLSLFMCVCVLPVSLCIYKKYDIYYLPLHTNDNIHTSVPLLFKICKIYHFHLSTQKSIFVGFFLIDRQCKLMDGYTIIYLTTSPLIIRSLDIINSVILRSLINTLFLMYVKISVG